MKPKRNSAALFPAQIVFLVFVSSGAVLGQEGAGRCLQEPDFQLRRNPARLSAFASREYTSAAAAVTAMQAQRPQGVASPQFAFPLKTLKKRCLLLTGASNF